MPIFSRPSVHYCFNFSFLHEPPSCLWFKFHYFSQCHANNNLYFHCICLAKCYFCKHSTIFLCATYPHSGASEENHPKEQICGTFILSSSLSWALSFALNSPISPVATHCPQPFLLYPTLNTNTFPSHLVFNNPIPPPPPGSNSHWNPQNFCHQSYSLPGSESLSSKNLTLFILSLPSSVLSLPINIYKYSNISHFKYSWTLIPNNYSPMSSS